MEGNKKNFKSFDSLIDKDKKGNFLIESSSFCFNECIDKITEEELNLEKTECLKDCYTKMKYAFDKQI